jgi:rhamnosyl/mannosyltransferase
MMIKSLPIRRGDQEQLRRKSSSAYKPVQLLNARSSLWESLKEVFPISTDILKDKFVTIISSKRSGIFAREYRIAKTLIGRGSHVKILSWDREGRLPKFENIEGIEIVNCGLVAPKIGKYFGLLMTYPIWWLYVFFYIRKDKAQIIQPENLFSIIPILLLKISGDNRKIIYDLVDYVADSFRWPNSIRKILDWFENYCLKFCDGVIVVDKRKQKLDSSHIRDIAEVTNCPEDLKDEFPVVKSKESFMIYYGGWLTETRGLTNLIDAIRNLDDVRLIVAGSGDYESKLKEQMLLNHNIEFLGQLTFNESLRITAMTNLVFVFYDPAIRINRLASPAKLFDAMMFGVPVMANSEAILVADAVLSGECGLVVPYHDIKGIRAAVTKLKNNPEIADTYGKNGRKLFEMEYNWGIMGNRLIELYERVLCPK